MASSLYQNAGPGRPPPPPGTYRQNPPPPPPPGQYGAPNPYSYGGGPPPAYAAPAPPRQMSYNPTYAYGSATPYGPPGVPNQNQYPPVPQYSLSSHLPPPPPPPPLPMSSAPPPPPPHPTQVSHHSVSFTSTTSQPHQAGIHTPYYPSIPSHTNQLPPPPPSLPISHSSSSQTSSHVNFPSTLTKQQSLPPPPPLPPHDSLKDPSLPPLPPINNASSAQPASAPAVPSRQNAAHIPASNNWVSGAEASNAGTAQGLSRSSGREGSNVRSAQGAWSLPTSQPLAYPASMQRMGSSQEMRAGVLPTDHSTVAKTAKTVSRASGAATALKTDNRLESEQDQRERRKWDYERKKLEEKREKEMQSGSIVHKMQSAGTPLAKYSSGIGLRDSRTDRKSGLSVDKVDNRLKRPSTFLCKIKFRNELPDLVSQPKLLQVNSDKDRYCKYTITSLERTQKHRLLVDSDLGIPLDLLDISVYNPSKVKLPMDPEDEDLLRDDDKIPSAKIDSVRKKDRPTDKGVAWLVKTTYISPINLEPAKQALTEKQAKELKELREGKRDFLDSLNDREQQIRSIEESFRVAKQQPVHQTKPGLQPVEVLPLLPDFDRWGDRLLHVIFDGEPTADFELHNKLDPTVRDELEEQAILKSVIVADPETAKQERFLSYMVPKVDELMKDIYDENEEISYTYMREYRFEVRPEDSQGMGTYVFSFGDNSVQYLSMGTKMSLQKKRAKEGRSKDETENSIAVPERVTVRRRDMTREEEEDRQAHRVAFTEGFPPAENVNSRGVKRRQSDEGALLPNLKRRGNEMDLSDDEEDAYM